MTKYSPATKTLVAHTAAFSAIILVFSLPFSIIFWKLGAEFIILIFVTLYPAFILHRVNTASFYIDGTDVVYRRLLTIPSEIRLDIRKIAKIRRVLGATIIQRYAPSLEFQFESDTDQGFHMRARRNLRNKFNLWRDSQLTSEDNYIRYKQIVGWDTPEIIAFLHALKKVNPDIEFSEDYAEMVEHFDQPEEYKTAVEKSKKQQDYTSKVMIGMALVFILFVFLRAAYSSGEGFEPMRFLEVLSTPFIDFYNDIHCSGQC